MEQPCWRAQSSRDRVAAALDSWPCHRTYDGRLRTRSLGFGCHNLAHSNGSRLDSGSAWSANSSKAVSQRGLWLDICSPRCSLYAVLAGRDLRIPIPVGLGAFSSVTPFWASKRKTTSTIEQTRTGVPRFWRMPRSGTRGHLGLPRAALREELLDEASRALGRASFW